jgi:hypothetical protein
VTQREQRAEQCLAQLQLPRLDRDASQALDGIELEWVLVQSLDERITTQGEQLASQLGFKDTGQRQIQRFGVVWQDAEQGSRSRACGPRIVTSVAVNGQGQTGRLRSFLRRKSLEHELFQHDHRVVPGLGFGGGPGQALPQRQLAQASPM